MIIDDQNHNRSVHLQNSAILAIAKMLNQENEMQLDSEIVGASPDKTHITSPEDRLVKYFASLHHTNATPLLTAMDKMVPPFPKPRAVPTSWEYSIMRLALVQAASIVDAEQAERRVLILVNEAMDLSAPYTTDTLSPPVSPNQFLVF
jgi:hypothetical protein